MSEFMNTADVIGDDELCDRILMRTVTEYNENRITKVGASAFTGCTELTSVSIPEVLTISTWAFSACSKLTSVNVPRVTTLGESVFYQCTALEKLCFPSVVEVRFNTSNWDRGIVAQCTSLKSVDLPVCTALSGPVFANATNLASVILRNTTVICSLSTNNAFGGTPIAQGTGYIYVPRALLEDYKVATNWSALAAQFRAIEDYTVDGTVTGELDESKL
jgi:hypothetical protein